MSSTQPTYSLQRVQELVTLVRYRISGTAVNGAGDLGFDEQDVVACVGALVTADFYKTMEATHRPGFWQDVYRPVYGGIDVYVKVQLEGTDPDDTAVLIQFKRR